MNSKTFNKILAFYQEGVAEETCICIILDKLEGSPKSEVATTIHRFYSTIRKDEVEKVYVRTTEGLIKDPVSPYFPIKVKP